MTTFWQLALNQSPFCRLLSACCFWPTALLSHGFLPLPSMLAVVSENYPHFSLLWDYGPVYWLAAAGHMLSSLVRCSFPHTDYSSGPREVKGCLPACRNTKNSSSNDNTLSQSMKEVSQSALKWKNNMNLRLFLDLQQRNRAVQHGHTLCDPNNGTKLNVTY